MSHPYLTIELDKIEHNARTIVELCHRHGLDVVGVTKCTCGYPPIAEAMRRPVRMDLRCPSMGWYRSK